MMGVQGLGAQVEPFTRVGRLPPRRTSEWIKECAGKKSPGVEWVRPSLIRSQSPPACGALPQPTGCRILGRGWSVAIASWASALRSLSRLHQPGTSERIVICVPCRGWLRDEDHLTSQFSRRIDLTDKGWPRRRSQLIEFPFLSSFQPRRGDSSGHPSPARPEADWSRAGDRSGPLSSR